MGLRGPPATHWTKSARSASITVTGIAIDTVALNALPTWTAICTFMGVPIGCSRSSAARPPVLGGRALAATGIVGIDCPRANEDLPTPLTA